MKKINNKGIIPISLYIGLGALVLLVIAAVIIWGQHQEVLKLKDQVQKWTTAFQRCDKQSIENVNAIVYWKEEYKKCTKEPCKSGATIVSSCPEVKIIRDSSKDEQLKELDDLFRRSQ